MFNYTEENFVEDKAQSTYFDVLFSKGTNYSCYLEYVSSLEPEDRINNTINIIRTVIYALAQPFQFAFFYWTLLIFIMHKFNFKKPIMKIILIHYVMRSIGHILDNFGGFWKYYFANDKDNKTGLQFCQLESSTTEMHPMKWFVTRQLGTIFWYVGEIFADWYPLLRTKAVVQKQRSIWYVYASCAFFNISKIVLIIYHFTLKPTELYDDDGFYNKNRVNKFYNTYWIIQLVIIYASVIYDYTVFFVLKKSVFKENKSEIGFMKKFRSISEYRILVSVFISIIFLPIVSIAIIVKFYYVIAYNYNNLEFSFDTIRQLIANGQYFMIFIDQILLLRSNEEASHEKNSKSSYLNRSTLLKSYVDKNYYNISDFGSNNNNNIFSSKINNDINYSSNSKLSNTASIAMNIDSPKIVIDDNRNSKSASNKLSMASINSYTKMYKFGEIINKSNLNNNLSNLNNLSNNSNTKSNNNSNKSNHNSNVSNINTNINYNRNFNDDDNDNNNNNNYNYNNYYSNNSNNNNNNNGWYY